MCGVCVYVCVWGGGGIPKSSSLPTSTLILTVTFMYSYRIHHTFPGIQLIFLGSMLHAAPFSYTIVIKFGRLTHMYSVVDITGSPTSLSGTYTSPQCIKLTSDLYTDVCGPFKISVTAINQSESQSQTIPSIPLVMLYHLHY